MDWKDMVIASNIGSISVNALIGCSEEQGAPDPERDFPDLRVWTALDQKHPNGKDVVVIDVGAKPGATKLVLTYHEAAVLTHLLVAALEHIRPSTVTR